MEPWTPSLNPMLRDRGWMGKVDCNIMDFISELAVGRRGGAPAWK